MSRVSTLPPVYHILLDGTRMNETEFTAWKKSHTIPRTCPVYDVLREINRGKEGK